jgi:YrhK-like protein
MSVYSESLPLFAVSKEDEKYPEPLSLSWRIHHWIGYMIGGIGFIIGSIVYLPSYTNYSIGAWAYLIGSIGFLNADLLEWWKNNRVGCFMDQNQRRSFEVVEGQYMEPQSTFIGRFQRAENGLNFFFSAIGSTFYVIGSILIIPRFNESVKGTEVYIYGSAIITLSQSWKLYRAGCKNLLNPMDKRFSIKNWGNDWPGFYVDAYAGLGGFAYLVGSIYFLPSIDVDNTITWIGAIWFNIGGIFFTLSGLYMFYRYFFTLNFAN